MHTKKHIVHVVVNMHASVHMFWSKAREILWKMSENPDVSGARQNRRGRKTKYMGKENEINAHIFQVITYPTKIDDQQHQYCIDSEQIIV